MVRPKESSDISESHAPTLRKSDAADRTSLVLYNETAPPAVADLVRAFKEPDQ